MVDGEPTGSESGFDRPVLIVQSDKLNRSRLNTVLAVPLTGQIHRAQLDTNVFIPKSASGLPHDSVAVTHLVNAINRDALKKRYRMVPKRVMEELDAALSKSIGLLD